MRGEGDRDEGQQEEDDGRNEGKPQRLLVLHGDAHNPVAQQCASVGIETMFPEGRKRRDKGTRYLKYACIVDPSPAYLPAELRAPWLRRLPASAVTIYRYCHDFAQCQRRAILDSG